MNHMKELKPTHVVLTTQMEELLEQWLRGEPPAKREMGAPASAAPIEQAVVEAATSLTATSLTATSPKRPLSLKDKIKQLKKAKVPEYCSVMFR